MSSSMRQCTSRRRHCASRKFNYQYETTITTLKTNIVITSNSTIDKATTYE